MGRCKAGRCSRCTSNETVLYGDNNTLEQILNKYHMTTRANFKLVGGLRDKDGFRWRFYSANLIWSDARRDSVAFGGDEAILPLPNKLVLKVTNISGGMNGK